MFGIRMITILNIKILGEMLNIGINHVRILYRTPNSTFINSVCTTKFYNKQNLHELVVKLRGDVRL